MDTTTIETRIHNAIRPQLDYADELLDHYLQDAPRSVWEPIMERIRPRPAFYVAYHNSDCPALTTASWERV